MIRWMRRSSLLTVSAVVMSVVATQIHTSQSISNKNEIVRIPLSLACEMNNTLSMCYERLQSWGRTRGGQPTIVFCDQTLPLILEEIQTILTFLRRSIVENNAEIVSEIDNLTSDFTLFDETICSKLQDLQVIVEEQPGSVFDEIVNEISLQDLVICTKLMMLETRVSQLESVTDECAIALAAEILALEDALKLNATLTEILRITRQIENSILSSMGE